MKLLDGSGGSTKGIGILSAWTTLYNDYKYYPDIISGISVSAIFAVAFALGKFKEMESLFLNLTLKDIFSKSPVNEKGNITICALWRAFRGKALGEQRAVIKHLSDIVSQAEFEAYKRSAMYPDVVIMSVDLRNARRIFVNVKSLSYKDFLEHTLASGSIPGYTMPVTLDGVQYDGGVRDHSIAAYMMEKYPIKTAVSVFSRPKDLSALAPWEPKNLSVDVLMRTIDILNYEISKGDEHEQQVIAERNSIELHQLFLPKVLQSLYDLDHARLRELHQAGKKMVHDYFTKSELVSNESLA